MSTLSKTRLLTCLFFVFGEVSFINAAALTISGQVAAINEIQVEDLGLKTGVLGQKITANTEIPMMKFRLNNNSPSGFYVNFSSQKSGLLTSELGKKPSLSYTISTKPDTQSANSRLGTTEPENLSNVSLQEDAQLFFTTQVREATRNHAYILSIASTDLADATTIYSDELTITIHNL